jgi:hypothetical protein
MGTKEPVTKKTEPRPIIESHGLSGPLSGENDGAVLAGWLNEAKGSAAYTRVVELLRLIEENTKTNNEARAAGAYRPSAQVELSRRFHRQGEALHSQLTRSLARYEYRAGLALGILDTSWRLNIFATKKQKGDFAWQNSQNPTRTPKGTTVLLPTPTAVWEADVVLAALRLAEQGLLKQVRLCAMCSQKWMFAHHVNYRFCGEECREKYFRDTDEYREKKAKQMRNYRARLKRRN